MAPQWSHVSRRPPSRAVRHAAIARSATAWTLASRCVQRYASPWARTRSARVRRSDAIAAVACAATTHTALPGSRVESIEQIQRGPGRGLRVSRQLKVPGRGTQMAVAQQALDRVEVDAAFQ